MVLAVSARRHINDRTDSQVSFPGGFNVTRASMAPKNTPNAQNLEALGAKRLAELLIEISSGDAAAKRRLRLALADTAGPPEARRADVSILSQPAIARPFGEDITAYPGTKSI